MAIDFPRLAGVSTFPVVAVVEPRGIEPLTSSLRMRGRTSPVQGGYGKASVAPCQMTPAELSTFGMFLYELGDRRIWCSTPTAR
jgi:hypothetical protein